jgi:hypothetical protein
LKLPEKTPDGSAHLSGVFIWRQRESSALPAKTVYPEQSPNFFSVRRWDNREASHTRNRVLAIIDERIEFNFHTDKPRC